MMEVPRLKEVLRAIHNEGGTSYFVGGCVRDELLGYPSKDVDVEVFGITPQHLKKILSRFGEVNEVGSSFGVLMIKGLDIDFSQPRTEKKTGEGHQGFEVTIDPFLPVEDAARRRDFTINAIMRNALTGEVVDPFGGMEDIKHGIIRHVCDFSFPEDPLRILRAAQFAGRFDFRVAPETIELARNIRRELLSVSRERVFCELEKLLLKSEKPSIGLRVLEEIGVLPILFPELEELRGCPQDPDFHPEGDVWEHTLLVVDEAAKLKDEASNPLAYMLAALIHDIGKPAVTEERDGKIIAYGHDKEGEEIGQVFLDRITNEKNFRKEVLSLVRTHMRPFFLFSSGASDKALRKLSLDANIEDVLLLARADHRGRLGANADEEVEMTSWFRGRIKELSIDQQKVQPVVTGRDLIELGLKPGPHFGRILSRAFDLQLEGRNKEEILLLVRKEFSF